MAIHIDEYYLRSISFSFEYFKEKGDHLFNVRCRICGDSRKSKSKARGFFYKSKNANRLDYVCHNCGASMSFANYLKEYEPEVYAEYAMEMFGKSKVGKRGSPVSSKDFVSSVDKLKRFSIPENTERVTSLSKDHPARVYMESRKIPKEHLAHMFLASDFNAFIRSYNLDIEASRKPRIIIPFYDNEWNLQGFQGRALPSNFQEIRYITIKLNEGFPKLWGLHRIDKEAEILYVTEGPIDAMFLDNAVAMMGSDIHHSDIERFSGMANIVYVFDNEPRSKEIQRRLEQKIANNEKVVIWNKSFPYKDLNDAIIGGLTKDILSDTIRGSTYSGMKAKLMFDQWRK